MKRKYNTLLVVFALVVGLFIGNFSGKYKIFKQSENQNTSSANTQTNFKNKNTTTFETKSSKNDFTTPKENSKNNNTNIPSKVYEIIDYIKKNNTAPNGYVGGRKFMNYERLLPETDEEGHKIDYQEWDVNPKISGKNRGTERLITGSDGNIYYTNDHYKSFNEVKLLE